MEIVQKILTENAWQNELKELSFEPMIILLFVSPVFKKRDEVLSFLRQKYPSAHITGCSTAGEISDVEVSDNTISLSAFSFKNVKVKKVSVTLKSVEDSFMSGASIGKKFPLPI